MSELKPRQYDDIDLSSLLFGDKEKQKQVNKEKVQKKEEIKLMKKKDRVPHQIRPSSGMNLDDDEADLIKLANRQDVTISKEKKKMEKEIKKILNPQKVTKKIQKAGQPISAGVVGGMIYQSEQIKPQPRVVDKTSEEYIRKKLEKQEFLARQKLLQIQRQKEEEEEKLKIKKKKQVQDQSVSYQQITQQVLSEQQQLQKQLSLQHKQQIQQQQLQQQQQQLQQQQLQQQQQQQQQQILEQQKKLKQKSDAPKYIYIGTMAENQEYNPLFYKSSSEIVKVYQ